MPDDARYVWPRRVVRRMKDEIRARADAQRRAKARNRAERRDAFPRVLPPRGRRIRNF